MDNNREERILRWLLNNPPNNQSVTNLGVEVIDVDALPDSGDEIPSVPLSQARNNDGDNTGDNNDARPPTPMVEDESQDERLIDTPSSINVQDLPDREEFPEYTNSSFGTVSSDIFARPNTRLVERERLLVERERKIKEKEEEIEATKRSLDHRLNNGAEKALKKKIDEWLAKPRCLRDPITDPEIVGYAMSQHSYLWLSQEERRRINSTRMELEEMIEIARRQSKKELCCPICFDLYKTPKPFFVLECGHIHCEDCIQEMDKIAGPERNARCGECLNDIHMDNLRRVYFASRE